LRGILGQLVQALPGLFLAGRKPEKGGVHPYAL
jgi:hypothetical protein